MLFSVIVPIYNVEAYLKRCIDSVLAQTFRDFELILVDDGSPDNCPQICDAYAKEDARIRVIHKENGGLVSARQAGIQIADGEYVFNLDADDAMTSDALESAAAILQQTNADMVTFSYTRCEENGAVQVMHEPVKEGLYTKSDMQEHIFPKILLDKNMQHMFYFVWGKAIRRSLVYPLQLAVNPAISLGEDLCCTVPCYLEAKNVYVSPKSVYLYTVRNNSISTKFNTKQLLQIADVLQMLHALPCALPADFEEQIARYACTMSFAILAAAAKGKFRKDLPEIKRIILNSVFANEIKHARFDQITIKSRITVFLLRRRMISTAFYFLYICERLKELAGKK